MIRRDYILRMIAEFIEVLKRIRAFKEAERWGEANEEIENQCRKLIAARTDEIARLTDTELLAKLLHGEPTQVIREKTAIAAALLREAGDVALASGRAEQANALYLRGLHLLLSVLGQGDVWQYPEFLPKIEGFTAALSGVALPPSSRARLMQHHELTGDFARAEDELYAILDSEEASDALLAFGTAFYERLRGRSDRELEEGNLPRAELEAGFAEFARRGTPTV